jgi:hypothetical protein
MNSHIAMQPSIVKDWFEPYRSSALQAIGIARSAPKKKPVVVYLDRNRNVSRTMDLLPHADQKRH